MSVSQLSTTQPSSPLPSLWTRLWRLPACTVARFTLRSYLRSGWVLADLVYIWFLYALFFYKFGGDVGYFYGIAGPWLGVLAVLDTVIIVQRSLRAARLYLPLSRLSSRSAYIRGLILATAIYRIPAFLLLLLLAGGYHNVAPNIGIQHLTPLNMLLGALGLLLNCVILSTLTVVLSIPVATRKIQIVFLVWLVGVLYANTNANVVAQYLVVTHIPLAPILFNYGLGLSVSTSLDLSGLLLLVLSCVYIVGLTWVADLWLKRRDLILF